MASWQPKQLILGGAGGVLLTLAGLVIMREAGVVVLSAPARVPTPDEQMIGHGELGAEIKAPEGEPSRALVVSRGFRGAWFDVGVRLRDRDKGVGVVKTNQGRCQVARTL